MQRPYKMAKFDKQSLCPKKKTFFFGMTLLHVLAQAHIGFGLPVRAFVKNRACEGFEISYMDSSWKNSGHACFFLSEFSPFLGLCPFEKIRMKSDACHILWTVHAGVLKFHIWIPHGKIADPHIFFFLVRIISLSGVMPLWKNQNEILSARYLKKYLS